MTLNLKVGLKVRALWPTLHQIKDGGSQCKGENYPRIVRIFNSRLREKYLSISVTQPLLTREKWNGAYIRICI